MIPYSVDKWIRYSLASTAFAMVLVLTPGALLDASSQADPQQIPVDALESSDECLWCTPPQWEETQDCDDLEDREQQWRAPDEVRTRDLEAPCGDEVIISDFS